jgi:ribose/xylose/arabinose/galactoside ABC-type transport system permease subunit
MQQAHMTAAEGPRARRVDTQLIILVGILLLIMVISTVLTPKFLSYVNMVNVLMQVAMIMLTGSAAVILMIAGNFDLSVGMVLALSGVMHAFMSKNGVPTALSMVLATLIGSAFGLLNGAMVTGLRITPVIATLGSMYVAQGLAFIVAWVDGGANVTTGLPRDFQGFGRSMAGPIPVFLVIVLALILLFAFIFAKTNLRKYAFAIGGNPVAARLSGIKVGGVVLALYVLVGTLTGFAGMTLASRMGSGSPKVGTGFEFDVIVAIVLGGTSIYGGEGSFLGMIIGALIIGFVGNTLNLLNIQFFYQIVLKGLILVGAVLLTRSIKSARG